jgi:hypothetical protein
LEKTYSLFNLTSGHPGLLAWALFRIEEKFEKQLSTLNQKIILNYIYSDEFLDSLTSYKTFDTLTPYNDNSHEEYNKGCESGKKELMKLLLDVKQSLKVVDPTKIIEKNEISSFNANFLMKSGIVIFQNEKMITWSFDYMRIFWLKRLSNKLEKEVEIADINPFIKEFLKHIPTERLKDSNFYQGVEKVNINNESFWQNEFYRVNVEKFGIKKIYPEFGGNMNKGEGKIDFYINSQRKWMIEFFVGEDKRKLHYNRFNTINGTYKDFEMNNFQIVNFVFQQPTTILQKWKGITFLHFNPKDNFKKATLYLFKRNLRSTKETEGDEWLKDVNFTNISYSKTLSLLLFNGTNLIGSTKIEEVPIQLDALNNKIRELFKDELKSNQNFSLFYDNKFQHMQLFKL